MLVHPTLKRKLIRSGSDFPTWSNYGERMDFEFTNPVISGVAGGLLAAVFCRALARWVPEVCNGKSSAMLLRENRIQIWIANCLFFSGILAGFALVQLRVLSDTDWRVIALGLGGGGVAALASLPLLAFLRGGSAKEAYVAYAISQKCPVILLYGILILLSGWFAAALLGLLAEHNLHLIQ
jgi:hypothetical protein